MGAGRADGYPVALFETGAINRDVVTYMRAKGYDLSGFARDNWARLGPLLRGKIHMFAGEMDEPPSQPGCLQIPGDGD